MKVYVVTAFTASPYENYSWIHGVYLNKRDAEASLPIDPYRVFDANKDNYDFGYILDRYIQEIEVQ